MTATVPGVIAWPVIVLMMVILTARYRLCRANLYDTYYNNLMALVLVAQLLREGSVESVLARSSLITVTTAQQLGFVAMVFASCELIGFTMLWTGLSPAETRRQHRYYRQASVISCVCFLAVATRARVVGQTLEVSGGWDGVAAWSFYLLVLLVMAARFIWMFASELRKAASRRGRLLATSGLVLGVLTAAGCLEALIFAVTDELGWTNTVRSRLWLHGFEFFCIAVFVYILGAVPLIGKLISRIGLDSRSRTHKRLRPLWLTMTTVVPDVALNIDHDTHTLTPLLQLHQMVIEIRDSILQLRPYFDNIDPDEQAAFLASSKVPAADHSAAIQALHLAHAARAKAAGSTPKPVDIAPAVRSRSTTLDEEAAELLKLTKWWAPAWSATQHHTASGPTTKSETPA